MNLMIKKTTRQVNKHVRIFAAKVQSNFTRSPLVFLFSYQIDLEGNLRLPQNIFFFENETSGSVGRVCSMTARNPNLRRMQKIFTQQV